MAYVRQRGNQLAIVHGERDPVSKKVGQRVLFTLYSKAEAREALGQGGPQGAERFQRLLENEYPELKFNWADIRSAINEGLAVLPDTYEYRAERLSANFRKDLGAFTRQLILADPQHLFSAAQLIQEHRLELEYLQHLISWRLKLCNQKETEWNRDNPFYWRSVFRGPDVPPEAEEYAAGFYERGEYERAQAVFHLLIDCFEGYAEGYNYLGLIALAQEHLAEASMYFEKTIELGRRLFPGRLAKKHYWTNLSTRPFMRGLRNLSLTLLRAGRYDEALVLCTRLEEECGDKLTATWHRAAIYLNTKKWRQAADVTLLLHRLHPEMSLLAGFALLELGSTADAAALYLHGALNHPQAAGMLLEKKTTPPKNAAEVADHNTGVSLLQILHGYLTQQRSSARRFFQDLLSTPGVASLLKEMEIVVRKQGELHTTSEQTTFDRMMQMRTPEFARQEAGALAALRDGG